MDNLAERFAKIPTKQKVALLIVIWGAIGALFYVLIYTDQQQQRSSLEAQLVRINADKQKLRVIAEEKVKFEKRLQELEDKRKKAQALLPDKARLEELTIELNRRARQSQIRITKITPMPEIPMGFYSRVPVQLKLEGTFHQLVVFFNHVAEMKRIVNIQNIELTKPARRDGQVFLKAAALATSFRSLKEMVQPKKKKKARKPAKSTLIQRGKRALTGRKGRRRP